MGSEASSPSLCEQPSIVHQTPSTAVKIYFQLSPPLLSKWLLCIIRILPLHSLFLSVDQTDMHSSRISHLILGEGDTTLLFCALSKAFCSHSVIITTMTTHSALTSLHKRQKFTIQYHWGSQSVRQPCKLYTQLPSFLSRRFWPQTFLHYYPTNQECSCYNSPPRKSLVSQCTHINIPS